MPASRLFQLVPLMLLFGGGIPVAAQARATVEFDISFDPAIRSEPFTGRILFFLSDELDDAPRLEHDWLSRQPIYSYDVTDWKPDAPLHVRKPMGFPYAFDELPMGRYTIQAVMHVNRDLPHSGSAPGNLYSETRTQNFHAPNHPPVTLRISKRVEERKPRWGGSVGTEVTLRSAKLSAFHGRDIFLRACVLLPNGTTTDSEERVPAIYSVPGFGGNQNQALRFAMMLGPMDAPFARIGLDATCGEGHHVYADSANNGPWGSALVDEFMPYLEKEFPLIRDAHSRYVTGHSSGGWSSLWLQLEYPETFGGVWASAPDSVTFADFTGIDLYDATQNFYRAPDDKRRPIMRQDGEVMLYLDDFARMENVLGPGGQMRSFEAVFGPRGANGQPRPLFDRATGAIDPVTVDAWRPFDLVKKIEREWPEKGDVLRGKITVITGSVDTFYLDGATRILKKTLKRLDPEARVFLVKKADHGTVMSSTPFRAILSEMTERFEGWQATREKKTVKPAA